ncbi:MAG: mechanosensitive ion channel [Gemmatimonadota bacterium]|nr:mechanosensitive ion channel [Gemmatimonadota bacterium]MDE2864766.1 mechanosensitive ion channel [Gemmatimonadota bacterium]
MDPLDHMRVSRRIAVRRPASATARRVGWLPVVWGLVVAGGCGERQPPEVEGDAVVAVPAEEAPSPGIEAETGPAPSPGAESGTPPGGEGEPPEGTAPPSSPPPEQTAETQEAAGTQNAAGTQDAAQNPPQATIDSLAAALRDITEAQQLILSRLDSIEEGVAAAPGEVADTATGVATLEEATDDVRNLGVKIFWALVILLVFHVLIRVIIWVLETLSERSVTRRLTFKWLIPITRMLLWAIATYLIVLNVFRVDAQGLLAASAALGVAVGIAAQDLLKNVLGGLIVVFDQPFQVGDKIRVGRSYGEVVSIGLRSTRVVTADDDLVTIPNSQVVGEQVANSNAGQLNCQVLTDLYLPGRVDERKAKAIAFEAAVTSRYVFLNKPIVVLVQDDFRTTFVTRIRVRAYVLDPRFEFVFQSDVTERAREGFRAAGLMPDRDWYPAVDPDGLARGTEAGDQ